MTMGTAMDNAARDVALQEMIDRAAIEDLFVRYFSGLGGGDPDWFGQFFTEGAELDVNGVVSFGRDEIGKLYRDVMEDKPNLIGTFRMILSNLLIDIDGDKATARAMWTQTINELIKGPPRFIEQGWEVDALERKDGKWRITKRVVTADFEPARHDGRHLHPASGLQALET